MKRIRLKDFRQSHGLYQSQLADIIGASQSVISRAELRGSCELTTAQYNALCEHFGKADVDTFCSEDAAVVSTGNTNNGGTQNNGVISSSEAEMSIIRMQSQALIELSRKQAEQTDMLLRIVQRLTGNVQ